MIILHMSDLHFSKPNYPVHPDKIRDGLVELIDEYYTDEEFYIIVTGDITLVGNKDGYIKAKSFFEYIFENTALDRNKFLFCPGNHDIVDKKFDEYSKFCYGIRRDDSFGFTKESNEVYFSNDKKICFLAINTSYEYDHTYGKVKIGHLIKLLEDNNSSISNAETRIVFCHHHILNSEDKDSSAIKNAYQFIESIKNYKFDFLFHGHQHARKTYEINGMQINSISSLLESEERVVSNGMIAIYNIKDNNIEKKEEFKYFKDSSSKNGKQGSFRIVR